MGVTAMTEASPDQKASLPVVLDAMGGDRAPSVVVDGAVLACERGFGPVTLVGDESRIKTELDRHAFDPDQITIVHAPEVIGMGENPIRAARTKRKSSMHLAYAEVVDGRGIATISAGNSGAFMAAGILTAKRTPGCDRPSIAACVPTGERITVLTDVGANVECRAAHLVQFAIMGATYHSLKFKGEPKDLDLNTVLNAAPVDQLAADLAEKVAVSPAAAGSPTGIETMALEKPVMAEKKPLAEANALPPPPTAVLGFGNDDDDDF